MALLTHLALFGAVLRAEDWPQFRGPNRDGVWREGGIMEKFPANGLHIRWRAAVGGGLAGPVIAHGRVYLHDAKLLEKPKVRERLHCFDEKTGDTLWICEREIRYPDWAFDPTQRTGPNATPVVQNGKVYTLGQMGDLLCVDAAKGAVIWQKNVVKEYGAKEFAGTTPSPLIEGNLLILAAGIQPGACVIAFDKDTGKEVWRALDDPWTYSSPVAINAGTRRQLIVWTSKAVTSLDPATGATWWREEMDTANYYGTAPAVASGDKLLLSGLMFQLDTEKPGATVLWPENKVPAKVVLSACSIPILQDGCVYIGKSSGQLVGLDAQTGKELWSQDNLTARGNGSTLHLTPHDHLVLILTDQGNLIHAKLSASGYQELSRVHVLDPTLPFGGKKVLWPLPAYANGHLFVRNDEELICASLQATP